MDNNFNTLINEVLDSINLDPNSELTQLKIKTVLQIIDELTDLPPYIYFIVIFLLAISDSAMTEEVQTFYHKVNKKITIFLINYNYFPMTEKDVKEYYDPNLANALPPLRELSVNVHKSGDIIHFVEHKYIDGTGRKFVSISVPDYNERQSILQFRLSEQLKSE